MSSLSPPLEPLTKDLFIEDCGASTSIDDCTECGLNLGLEAPCYEAPASTWLCGGCGSAYFAAAPLKQPNANRKGARPAPLHQVISAAVIDAPTRRRQLPHRELHRVLQFLSMHQHDGCEKRDDPRFSMAMPILTLPLSRSFRVCGPAAEMTTINISRRGGALLHAQACTAPFLVLDLTVAGLGPLLVLLEVLRVRPLVSAFEIAGRWHCRVDVSHAPVAAVTAVTPKTDATATPADPSEMAGPAAPLH